MHVFIIPPPQGDITIPIRFPHTHQHVQMRGGERGSMVHTIGQIQGYYSVTYGVNHPFAQHFYVEYGLVCNMCPGYCMGGHVVGSDGSTVY